MLYLESVALEVSPTINYGDYVALSAEWAAIEPRNDPLLWRLSSPGHLLETWIDMPTGLVRSVSAVLLDEVRFGEDIVLEHAATREGRPAFRPPPGSDNRIDEEVHWLMTIGATSIQVRWGVSPSAYIVCNEAVFGVDSNYAWTFFGLQRIAPHNVQQVIARARELGRI